MLGFKNLFNLHEYILHSTNITFWLAVNNTYKVKSGYSEKLWSKKTLHNMSFGWYFCIYWCLICDVPVWWYSLACKVSKLFRGFIVDIYTGTFWSWLKLFWFFWISITFLYSWPESLLNTRMLVLSVSTELSLFALHCTTADFSSFD